MSLLKVENVSVYYDSIPAVRNISLTIERGQVVGIIGPNGAGKTTLMKTLMGIMKTRGGKILLEGNDITSYKPYQRAKLGISLVPEGRQLFNTLTVKENLLLATHGIKEGLQERLKWVYELFPILKERQNQYAGTLSGGEQQMLAIARGLMSRPKLLLLDEPSLGLAPIIVEKLYETIKTINREQISLLIAEQHVDLAVKTAHYLYVMGMGEITLEGTGAELASSDEIVKVYLG